MPGAHLTVTADRRFDRHRSEPEVERWLESLPAGQFATVASRIEYLAEQGALIRMPRSRSLGEGLFELRFDLAQ
jgi:hypothetical protein